MKYTFDSRAIEPGDGFVALKGERVDGRTFIPQAREKGAVEIIEGLEALQARARQKRRTLSAKVIGVTGSAGKTTTKELLKAFLATVGRTAGTEGNFNNHIGLPLTILNCPADAEFLVLEMGTNHPGEIAALCEIAAPDVGLVTGIGTAHLEFFGTRAGIAQEKGTLLRSATSFGVYPSTDDFAADLAACSPQARAVAPEARALLEEGRVYPPHFEGNAALAFAVASSFGCTVDSARAALRQFSLPGSRWRRVEQNGVTFIDDTYNANPDSMIAALETLAATPTAGRRVAILGDMFELGAEALALHQKVFARAHELGFSPILGVGELARQCPCTRAYATCADLAAELTTVLQPGDLVLLKASHGMKLGELLKV